MSRHQCFVVEPLEGDDGGKFRMPDGSICGLWELPPGAMWPRRDSQATPGPDGKTWTVICPPGKGTHWSIDSGWTRTGEAPNFTVTPSILIRTTRFQYDPNEHLKVIGKELVTVYHGFLTNGVLESTPDSPC